MAQKSTETSSAGHKIGQLIGDWFEKYFVLPLLEEVADRLVLFLDNRFIDRSVRGDKVTWQDEEGNSVDFDFVLELEGTPNKIGIPVAFIECFWRRGARHSKDKARDDSGKLLPMRTAYPTARFLGIVSAGDFTQPARELVKTRDIDLFYIPKDKILAAFSSHGLVMDYPDKASEAEKQRIASEFEVNFIPENCQAVAETLVTLVGKAAVTSYTDRVRGKLCALPQEIRLILCHQSTPIVFEDLPKVTKFLENPCFQMDNPQSSYIYHVIYSDGTEFEQTVGSIDELKALHEQVEMLANHMSKV